MLKQALIHASNTCALVFRSAILILCSWLWYVAFQVAKFCLILLLAVGIAYSLFYFVSTAERARGQPIAHHRFELRTVARRENAIRNVEEIGDVETKYRREDAQGGYFTMLKRVKPEKESLGPTKERAEQKQDSAPSGKSKPPPMTGKTYEMQPTDTIKPSPAPSKGLRSSPTRAQQKQVTPSDGLKPSAGSSKKDESKVSEKFRKQDEVIATERAIPASTRARGIETKGEVAHKTEQRAGLKGDLEQTGPTTSEKGCWAKMVGFCCGSKAKNEQEKEPSSSKTIKQEKEPYGMLNIEEQQGPIISARSELSKERVELISSAKPKKPDEAITVENMKKQCEPAASEALKPTHATQEINKPKTPEMQAPVGRKHDEGTEGIARTGEIRERIRKREQYEPQSAEHHTSRTLRRSIEANKMSDGVDRLVCVPKDIRKSADARLERYFSEVYLKGTPKVRRVASDTWHSSAPSIGVPVSQTTRSPRDRSSLDDEDVSMCTFTCPRSARKDTSPLQRPREDRDPIRRRKLLDEFESHNTEKSNSSPTRSRKGTSPLQNQSTPYVVDANGVDRSISSTEKTNIIPSSKRPREHRSPLKRSERVEESEANEIDESMSSSAPPSTLTPYVIHDELPEWRKLTIRQRPLEDREPIRRRKLLDEFESHNMEESSSSPTQSFLKGTPKVHRVASDTWDPRSRSPSAPLPTKTHEDKARSASAPKESVNGRKLGEKNRVAARKSEGTRSEERSPSPGTSKKQLSPPRRKTG
uniref:Uncharacterized protein n=1 Tax=Glossina morsitans morsitans TaxID=37546 RepID=A0A905AWK8_GLOMM